MTDTYASAFALAYIATMVASRIALELTGRGYRFTRKHGLLLART